MAFYTGSSYHLNLPRTPDAFCSGASTSTANMGMNTQTMNATSTRQYALQQQQHQQQQQQQPQNGVHAYHHHQQQQQYSQPQQHHLGSTTTTMSSLAPLSATATRAADLVQSRLKGWKGSSTTSNGALTKSHSLSSVSSAAEGPGPLTPPMSTSFEARTTGSSAGYSHYQPQEQYRAQPQPQQPQPHAYSNATSNSTTSTTLTTVNTNSTSGMTLPPIAHLERHLSHTHTHLPPLTPPEDIPLAHTSKLPLSHPQTLPRISSADDFFSSSSTAASSSLGSGSGSKSSDMDTAMQDLPPIQHHLHQHHQQYEPIPIVKQTQTPYTHSNAHVQPPQPSSHSHIRSVPVAAPQPAPERSPSPEPAVSVIPAPPQFSDTPAYLVDWLDFTRTRSAHFIAEKTCEMICYLWFAPPSEKKSSEKWKAKKRRTDDSSPSVTLSSAMDDEADSSESESDEDESPESSPPAMKATATAPNALQLVASPTFVAFMQKLLETTQVSQSVIVLSLHYIHRLKQKNRWTPAQRGSEFRIAVAGLMMGNKFLDDNTYTNKTWSEVSGIEIEEINRMEKEFLIGVDFNLYVDKGTYEAWLNLLKGLVLAKEKDTRRYGRSREDRHHRERERAREERDRERERGRRISQTKRGATFAIPASSTKALYIPSDLSSVKAIRSIGNANGYSGSAFVTGSGYGHARRESYSRARSTSPRIRSSNVKESQPPALPAPTPVSSQAPAYQPASSQPPVFTHTYAPTHQTHSYLPSINTSTALLQPLTTPSASTLAPSSTPAPASAVGGKRTAEAAFSPTSAGFASVPSKRPLSMHGAMNGISLRIPEVSGTQAPSGDYASPLDSLQSFERMSLTSGNGASPEKERTTGGQKARERESGSGHGSKKWKSTILPQTLSTAYSYSVENDRRQRPQNLEFYALACSPVKDEPVTSAPAPTRTLSASEEQDRQHESEETRYVGYGHGQRKFRKYQQPLPPSGVPYAYADLNATSSRFYPNVAPTTSTATTFTGVNSSTVTPPQKHRQYTYPAPSTTSYQSVPSQSQSQTEGSLPHYRDDIWASRPAPVSTAAPSSSAYEQPAPAHYHHQDAVSIPVPSQNRALKDEDEDMDSTVPEVVDARDRREVERVPSAPFANAGPPGVRVQFYDNGTGPAASSSYAAYYAAQSGPGQHLHQGGYSTTTTNGSTPTQYASAYGYSTPPYHGTSSTYAAATSGSAAYSAYPSVNAHHAPHYTQSQYSSPVRYSSPSPVHKNVAGYPPLAPELDSPLRRHQLRVQAQEEDRERERNRDREQRYLQEEQERYHQRYSQSHYQSKSAYSSPQYTMSSTTTTTRR